jgi:hypothetical protein
LKIGDQHVTAVRVVKNGLPGGRTVKRQIERQDVLQNGGILRTIVLKVKNPFEGGKILVFG